MKQIYLASQSPRRKAILEQVGLKFEQIDPDFDESSLHLCEPAEYVAKSSLVKAESAAAKLASQQLAAQAIIISADTVVVYQGEIIGKPVNAAHALETLLKLSGNEHEVMTGFTLFDTETGKKITRTIITKVTMLPIDQAHLEAYIATGEPLDKAGSYAIQGIGAFLIKGIEGDYYNAFGLPVAEVVLEFANIGINVFTSEYNGKINLP